jgi:hypothetical protein
MRRLGYCDARENLSGEKAANWHDPMHVSPDMSCNARATSC